MAVMMLVGCETEKAVQVQPVSIRSDSFCDVMRGILPPLGKPTWDIVDSKQTIRDARKVGAAVDKKCASKTIPPSA
jgi:hypothetical protein